MPVNLEEYQALQSTDSVKRDLELTHTVEGCGEHLCDVEPDDTIWSLMLTIEDHAKRCPHGTRDRPVKYLTLADFAGWFGLSKSTTHAWTSRHKDFPEPDALIGPQPVAGWLPSREAEIRAWYASRPGRGAGGGRPRRSSQG